MAVEAKDGSMHHSATRARMHDQMAAGGEEKPAGKAAGKHKDVSNMSIEDVVDQHGPAHQIHIQHDHEAGTHQVTSHHGDAGDGGHHVHRSKHGSVKEAHEHAMKAAGEGAEDEDTEPYAGKETPDEEEAEEHGIPGMA